MDPSQATREVYWNITQVWVMYLLLVPTTAIAVWGFYRRYRLWKKAVSKSLDWVDDDARTLMGTTNG